MKSANLILILLFGSILFAANFKLDDLNIAPESSLINNQGIASEKHFSIMMDVVTHKRCINCHPSDNIPKQGEESNPHYFGISRGIDNIGFEATNCKTCHQEENNEYSGVPGAPHWSLAPASMSWEGLTKIQIAESMLDLSKNGGRSYKQVMKHLTEDALVLWAWEPGINAAGLKREVPPVSKDAFIDAVKNWFEAGAIIPSK